jgi:drug/metabolite transporter, DME family
MVKRCGTADRRSVAVMAGERGPRRLRSTAAVLIGATLLGSLGAWARAVYRFEGDPLTVVAWRALIAAAALAGVLGVVRPRLLRIRPRDLPFFLLYGFVGVTVNFWAYFSAVKFTSLAIAVTLLFTFPAFVALLSFFFLGERLTQAKLAAVAVTLLGSGLVVQIHRLDLVQLNLPGILFGLVAALCMATYSLLGKRAMARYSPWTVVLYGFAAGGFFLALGSGPGMLAAHAYPPVAWLWIVGLALVPSLGGYALFNLGLRDLPASQASVIAAWEVVTAAGVGWMLFGEALAPAQFLGAALVCCGIWWIQRDESA